MKVLINIKRNKYSLNINTFIEKYNIIKKHNFFLFWSENTMIVNILFVEDNINDVDLVLQKLKVQGFHTDYKVVDNANDLKIALEKETWDLIISDHLMPGFNALKAYEILIETGLDIPFVVFSGVIKQEEAIEIMRRGAKDYLSKDNLEKIPYIVQREITGHRKRKEEEKYKIQQEMIFNNISDMVFLIEINRDKVPFKISGFNKSAMEKLGYKYDELINKNPYDLVPFTDEQIESIKKDLDSSTSASRKMKIFCKKGFIHGDLKITFLKYDSKKFVIASVRDISEEEKIQKSLLNSEERFSKVFHNASIGIIVADFNGKILDMNKHLINLLEISITDVLNKNISNWNILGKNSNINHLKEELEKCEENKYQYEDEIETVKSKTVKNVRYNFSCFFFRSDDKKVLLGTMEDITEVVNAKKQLEIANKNLFELVNLDGLTRIPNRRNFDRKIQEEWKRMKRQKKPISLLMIDIDKFKDYNDTYGHLEGDSVLKTVANIIYKSVKRPGDIAARFGGEEFVVLLPDTKIEGARFIAEKIMKDLFDINLPNESSDISDRVTVSIGLNTVVPDENNSPYKMINLSDIALYRAKSKGRNRIEEIENI